MKTIQELRLEGMEVWQDLRAGKISPAVAKELHNGIGKAYLTVKAELMYAELRKERPFIPFVHGDRKESNKKVVPFKRKAA